MLHDEPPPPSPPPPRAAAPERAGASYPPSHADPPQPARDAQDAESIESVDITMSPPQSLNTEPENLGARSTTTRKPRALPDMQTMATRRAYKQALKRTMPPTPPKADATPEPTVAKLVATLTTLKNVMDSDDEENPNAPMADDGEVWGGIDAKEKKTAVVSPFGHSYQASLLQPPRQIALGLLHGVELHISRHSSNILSVLVNQSLQELGFALALVAGALLEWLVGLLF